MRTITYPDTKLKNINTTIGISGTRLCGKDFIAKIISDKLDLPTASLADPIKDQYSTLMDIPLESLYTQGENKEMHRLGLIALGALRRSQHIDWWCEDLHKKYTRSSVIIPDIRFKNEVEYFKKHSNKFVLFNVIADKSSLIERGWKPSFADTTSTEMGIKEFRGDIDYTINNSNSMIHSIKGLLNKVLNQFDLLNT